MTIAASLAAALRAAAHLFAPAPLAEIKTGAGLVATVLRDVEARRIDLADVEAVANGVQQILVDLGVEPGLFFTASRLIEALAPAFVKVAACGFAHGAFDAAPRGGPPIAEGEPWRGPQPVDNPSGAIGGPDAR